MVFIAIASEEYLGYYKVLHDSIRKYYPNATQTLYYIGENSPKGFSEVYGINRWYDQLNPNYSKLEKICSLRAKVVLDAFNEDYDKVVFLGAKVEFFHKSDELEKLLDDYDAVVTPHILEPLPEDGLLPSNASVAWTGHISTDVVAFKNTPEINKFLIWQDEIMKTKVKTTNYTYLDQSWLNFLPFFVPNVKILNHPGYNVAYWNYKQRDLKLNSGKWKVKDYYNMVCFQYSGLDLNAPQAISTHQNRYKADGDFLNFLTNYANRVKEYK